MGEWGRAGSETSVCEVGDRFGGGGKDRRAIFPPHGKHQRKCNQRVGVVGCWECHSQFWDVVDGEGNAVEAVADVELDEVDRAKGRVGEEDFA